MKKVFVFLADGFEDIEAISPIDVLRRAGADVKTVSVMPERVVKSAHGVPMMADVLLGEVDCGGADLLVLPGGMPGTNNLNSCTKLKEILKRHYEVGGLMGAICAAPLIYGELGFLKGRQAVCYPGFEGYLTGATVGDSPVVKDGNVITSRGAGCAVEFALVLVEALFGTDKAKEIGNSIIYKK